MEATEILSGLGMTNSAEKQETLMGSIVKMNPEQRRAAFAKIQGPQFGSRNKNRRDLALERITALPNEIMKALVDKRMQFVDSELYSVKPITGKTQVIFFEDADTIKEGFTNVNNAKLKKDEFFLITGIQYQEGFGASPTDPTGAFFFSAGATSANGDYDLIANGNKYLIGERSPISMFTDVTGTGGYEGKFNAVQVDNPKWIEPQVNIKGTFRYAAANAASNLFGKLKLIGISCIPY